MQTIHTTWNVVIWLFFHSWCSYFFSNILFWEIIIVKTKSWKRQRLTWLYSFLKLYYYKRYKFQLFTWTPYSTSCVWIFGLVFAQVPCGLDILLNNYHHTLWHEVSTNLHPLSKRWKRIKHDSFDFLRNNIPLNSNDLLHTFLFPKKHIIWIFSHNVHGYVSWC